VVDEHHPLDVRLHDDAGGDAELEVAREALPAEAAAAQAECGDGNAGEVGALAGTVALKTMPVRSPAAWR